MIDLMSRAPCGFVSFRDDGTIVEVNETLAEMLGFERLELVGWHVDKLFPPGGRIFYHTYLFPMLKVHERVEEIYVALRTKGGGDIPVLLNGIRRIRGEGYVSDCVCLRMIQRHAYEDQLLEARRLAEEATAAKAKFLSMMSHDLRTPLTTIDGNAQLLERGSEALLSPSQMEAVAAIREACRVQLAMITDILDFARLDSGNLKVRRMSVSVADSVRRAIALVHVQIGEAGLQLTTSECQGDVAVAADPQRLQQILLNLLTNAMKFTPPGGAITISCVHDEQSVRISVRDTGIGIAPDDLQRIFTPFVQLAAEPTVSTHGVGLGLAISRELARAMGGDVTAQSEERAGSVFTLELPAGQAAVPGVSGVPVSA